jgi:hypothetical protein
LADVRRLELSHALFGELLSWHSNPPRRNWKCIGNADAVLWHVQP